MHGRRIGEVELWLHPFLTSELDGVSDEPNPCRFTSREEPTLPIEQVIGWGPQPFWTFCKREKFLFRTGFRVSFRSAVVILELRSAKFVR